MARPRRLPPRQQRGVCHLPRGMPRRARRQRARGGRRRLGLRARPRRDRLPARAHPGRRRRRRAMRRRADRHLEHHAAGGDPHPGRRAVRRSRGRARGARPGDRPLPAADRGRARRLRAGPRQAANAGRARRRRRSRVRRAGGRRRARWLRASTSSCSKRATASAAGSGRRSSQTARSSRWAPSSSSPATTRSARYVDRFELGLWDEGHALRRPRAPRRDRRHLGGPARGRRDDRRGAARRSRPGSPPPRCSSACRSTRARARRSGRDSRFRPQPRPIGSGRPSSPGSQPTRTTSARASPAATSASRWRSPRELGATVHLSSPVERVAWGEARRGRPSRRRRRSRSIASCWPSRRASSTRSPSNHHCPIAARAYAAVEYGNAAKLFVPLTRETTPSAVLSVPERYWSWTATGADGVQPVVNAFAGSAPALARLRVTEGPETWLDSLRRLRPDLALSTDGAVLSTWDDDPWVGAAYSCAAPGVDAWAPAGPFHACGEHTHETSRALMDGALASGLRAAQEVLGRQVRSRPQFLTVRSNILEVVRDRARASRRDRRAEAAGRPLHRGGGLPRRAPDRGAERDRRRRGRRAPREGTRRRVLDAEHAGVARRPRSLDARAGGARGGVGQGDERARVHGRRPRPARAPGAPHPGAGRAVRDADRARASTGRPGP